MDMSCTCESTLYGLWTILEKMFFCFVWKLVQGTVCKKRGAITDARVRFRNISRVNSQLSCPNPRIIVNVKGPDSFSFESRQTCPLMTLSVSFVLCDMLMRHKNRSFTSLSSSLMALMAWLEVKGRFLSLCVYVYGDFTALFFFISTYTYTSFLSNLPKPKVI